MSDNKTPREGARKPSGATRSWEPAGPDYPGVYVSTVSPMEVLTPAQRDASYEDFETKYRQAAQELAESHED